MPRIVTAAEPAGTRKIPARPRIDTLADAAYYRHGSILPYVLRRLATR